MWHDECIVGLGNKADWRLSRAVSRNASQSPHFLVNKSIFTCTRRAGALHSMKTSITTIIIRVMFCSWPLCTPPAVPPLTRRRPVPHCGPVVPHSGSVVPHSGPVVPSSGPVVPQWTCCPTLWTHCPTLCTLGPTQWTRGPTQWSRGPTRWTCCPTLWSCGFVVSQ